MRIQNVLWMIKSLQLGRELRRRGGGERGGGGGREESEITRCKLRLQTLTLTHWLPSYSLQERARFEDYKNARNSGNDLTRPPPSPPLPP